MKKKVFVLLFVIIVIAAMTIPAFANGTTDTPVSYYECITTLVSVDKEWYPDGNVRMLNARYISEISDASDPRLSGIIYGNERVVFANSKLGYMANFQGTVQIENPYGTWKGSWRGDGVLGEYWEIDIVLHGIEGEVDGLQAFITTTSETEPGPNFYWCASSTGLIVNPGDK